MVNIPNATYQDSASRLLGSREDLKVLLYMYMGLVAILVNGAGPFKQTKYLFKRRRHMKFSFRELKITVQFCTCI